MLEIRLLGPLEVAQNGEQIRVTGAKTRTLLTRLALDVGSAVSTDRLIDALWGDEPPENALNALQAKVSELRRALGSDRVLARPPGYELVIDRNGVDAHRFVDLVATARNLSSDHPEQASDNYISALTLWRGTELAGYVDPQSGLPLTSPLHELRLAAFEERCHLEIAAGRGRTLVGELTESVTEHPLRESLVELLMLALAAGSRQADALAAYRKLRTRLIDQLGIEPSPRLQELEAKVLAHDPAVIDSRDPAFRPTRHLPSPLSSFIDRPEEVARLVDLLSRRRLVTITGPGGAGKTRLAIEAASRIDPPSDGIWFVALEDLSVVDGVHDAIAAVLGAVGPDAVMALRSRLRDASLLLVIDNCEHLDLALGNVVRQLLEDAPGLSILATSQRALGLPGEAQLTLGPLPRAPARQLFVERARDLVPELGLDELGADRRLIEQICAQVDDLPLAIELAAGRCDVLSLDEIAEHIRSGLTVLRDAGEGRAPRHRTLDSTISWSYDLLFPDAQLTLQSLAWFVGGAPIEGLQAVVTSLGLPEGEVLDLVSHLVERSIVVVERYAAGSRYHLLDSIRSFARARAVDDARDDTIADAHASWVAEMASEIITGLRTETYFGHLGKIRIERSNIDAALGRLMQHDPTKALTTASGLCYAWMILGDAAAGASRIEQALAAASTTVSDDQKGLARARSAQLLARSGSVQRAVEVSETAMAEVACGSEASRTEVQSIRGKVLVHAGRYDEGRALEVDARVRFEALGDIWGVAMANLTIGWADLLVGDHDGAGRETRAALAALGTTSQPWIMHAGHRLLGVLDNEAGRYDDALGHFAIALDTARAMGSLTDEGQTLARIATTQLLRGDHTDGLSILYEALSISRLAGDQVTASAVSHQIESFHN